VRYVNKNGTRMLRERPPNTSVPSFRIPLKINIEIIRNNVRTSKELFNILRSIDISLLEWKNPGQYTEVFFFKGKKKKKRSGYFKHNAKKSWDQTWKIKFERDIVIKNGQEQSCHKNKDLKLFKKYKFQTKSNKASQIGTHGFSSYDNRTYRLKSCKWEAFNSSPSD